MSGFDEHQMELAEKLVTTRVERVMSALAEKIGVEQLVTFVIERELVVINIGENNPWFQTLEVMKANGETCRCVFNQAIGSHMVIVVGQASEDHVRSCVICSASA